MKRKVLRIWSCITKHLLGNLSPLNDKQYNDGIALLMTCFTTLYLKPVLWVLLIVFIFFSYTRKTQVKHVITDFWMGNYRRGESKSTYLIEYRD